MTREEAIKRSEVLREEIYALVIKINGEGVDTVFFTDAPHVSWIEIRIYSNGWTGEKKPIVLTGFYASPNVDFSSMTPVKRVASLRKIRMALKEMLKGNYRPLYKAYE